MGYLIVDKDEDINVSFFSLAKICFTVFVYFCKERGYLF